MVFMQFTGNLEELQKAEISLINYLLPSHNVLTRGGLISFNYKWNFQEFPNITNIGEFVSSLREKGYDIKLLKSNFVPKNETLFF